MGQFRDSVVFRGPHAGDRQQSINFYNSALIILESSQNLAGGGGNNGWLTGCWSSNLAACRTFITSVLTVAVLLSPIAKCLATLHQLAKHKSVPEANHAEPQPRKSTAADNWNWHSVPSGSRIY
jgi:hypothetical protein